MQNNTFLTSAVTAHTQLRIVLHALQTGKRNLICHNATVYQLTQALFYLTRIIEEERRQSSSSSSDST